MIDETEIAEAATPSDAAAEAELLARIVDSSEFVDTPEVPQFEDLDDEAEEEDIEEVEEVEELDETEEESEDETEEEEETEEEAEEPQAFSEDEIDWEYQIPVTIDGKTESVSLEEVRKGYATQQHLSAQGRELGEARKAFEEESQSKLAQLDGVVEATSSVLMQSENALAQEYHELKTQLDDMDEDDYDFDKVERQVARKQQAYWKARQEREGMVEAVSQQRQQQTEQQWNEQVQTFYDSITDEIPEWTPEYNEEIRKFATEEVGLTEEFLNYVTDPKLVKAMDDFRKLKQGTAEGAKKRAKAPVKRAPTRKARSEKQKKESKENQVRARAFNEDATAEEQMDFLRQHASKSLGDR